jgi:hypothetical protein
MAQRIMLSRLADMDKKEAYAMKIAGLIEER